ncbi:MAG: hypothetical protein GXY33_06500 [Phycisphaerae bacterium]|nr:hypothetical protein [Phycisphaerae bacterium]
MASNVKILAHRGVSGLYPENSRIAMEKSVELAVDGIETDLRITSDGQIVLMHDAALDRTTDGTGAVIDHTLDQLRQRRLKGPAAAGADCYPDQTVMTLDELFDLLKSTSLHLRLEVKEIGFESLLVDRIKQAGLVERTMVSSFIPTVPLAVKTVDRTIRTALLTSRFDPAVFEQILPHVDGVDLGVNDALTADVVRRVRDHGLAVSFWTIDRVEDFRRALQFEPDYIMSNIPQRMLKELGRQVPQWADSAA